MTDIIIKKKRVNSKAKGQGNERKVAKLLSDSLAPLTFMRTPGSGAFVGGKNFAVRGGMFSNTAMQTFVGDITPTNEEDNGLQFNFVVECKHYKTPDSFDSLFTGKHSIYGWLTEVSTDCVKIGKKGIVICKWNGTPFFCAVRPEIELPCPFLTLPSGDKICYLNDLLVFKDFWCSKK
jgi:hypothetical protein